MKILIVDDNKIIRTIIKKELEGLDVEFAEVSSGEEAIRYFVMHDDISLITLDLNMEGFSGFETLEKIRHLQEIKKREAVPVIFVTSSDSVRDRFKGFELGAINFLVKPFENGQLYKMAEEILFQTTIFSDTNILVVDDCKISQRIIKKSLENEGAKVTVINNSKDARKFLSENIQDLDLVFLEYNLPDINGIELTFFIRHNLGNKKIPVIITSPDSSNEEILNFFTHGITDYITKPFLKEELVARLHNHLERIKSLKLLDQKIQDNELLIEKLKESNDSLRTTQNKLLQSEKKNAVLATGVTANHEINQPLMILQGNLDLLVHRIGDNLNEKEKKYLDKSFNAINRIQSILNKLKNIDSAEYTNYSDNQLMLDLSGEFNEE
ncbi:MAG: hypothetical protein CSB55_05540 [Candidatus Cloacimonadota bacterium]|nr:MAG: hypothetical protein CSB55_05540 [Candidatus Cloacimonadota bacterium]